MYDDKKFIQSAFILFFFFDSLFITKFIYIVIVIIFVSGSLASRYISAQFSRTIRTRLYERIMHILRSQGKSDAQILTFHKTTEKILDTFNYII